MNQLPKALFIGLYPVICLAAVILSLLELKDGFTISALGLFFTAFPMLVFLGQLFLRNIARTDRHLMVYSFLVFGGFLMTMYGIVEGSGVGILQILSVISLVGWLLYVGWYSVFQNRDSPKLAVGNQLIDFPLEDDQGNPVSSKSFLGTKNIFLFYRGNWCPLCMAQIKEIASRYKELEAKGVQTNLISPQSHKHTKSLAQKFDVGFKFWVDKNNRAAKALNIFAKNGLPFGLQVLGYESDTVMPTIILTDENGRILYTDLTANYRIRPEPEAFLKFF